MSFLYIPVSRGSNGSNTFVGVSALASVTTGVENSAFGYQALQLDTTGNFNSAFGSGALQSNNGSDNSAFGRDALTSNTTGGVNSAFGSGALSSNTTGINNSAFGSGALAANVSGSGNVAFGIGALALNTAASRSVALGEGALGNSGLGGAGGQINVGIGFRSGLQITSGEKNAIIGSFEGNSAGIDIRNLSNNIVLSDGDGNPRYAYLNATSEHLWKAGGAGATVGRLLQSVTGASTDALLDITGTWNTTGAANGIRLNVTDTASAAGALLMDLRAGGVSRFRTDKNGSIRFGQFSVGFDVYSTGFILTAGGNFPMFIGPSFDVHLPGAGTLGWTSIANNPYGVGDDLVILRDAADTLAQRRGVNAQAFRIYGTYTDASNFERLSLSAAPGGYIINTQVLGTGVVKTLSIRGNTLYLGGTQNNDNWLVNVSGHFGGTTDNAFDIGATAANRPRNLFLGSYMQLSEMTAPAAPAANNVVIYAEDNGSGKTRLMARFATGAAQQIAIEP